jgi:hypothetical protein
MKLLTRLAIVVVLLLAVLLGVAWAYLDEIVQNGITTVGPALTKVDVTVRNVRLSPLNGHGAIEGLVVGNPAGFKSAEAIRVEHVAMNLVARSLLEDKVIVESLVIESPEVTIEGGMKSNNLTAISDNIEASIKALASEPKSPKPKGQGKKLQVNKLSITGIRARLAFGMLQGKGITIPVPDIHLSGLGQGPAGISGGEVTRQVMRSLTTGTLNAVASQITNLPDVLGNAGGAVLEGADKLGDNAADRLKKGIKGVGNLFKK